MRLNRDVHNGMTLVVELRQDGKDFSHFLERDDPALRWRNENREQLRVRARRSVGGQTGVVTSMSQRRLQPPKITLRHGVML